MAYTVIRDTREKAGHGWRFKKSEHCLGQIVETLQSGDYTLQGFEDILSIERKGSVSEFAHNLFDARFKAELERLEEIRFSFVILEFTMKALIQFPVGSGIPAFKWKYLKIKGPQMLKRLTELSMHYSTKFLFCGAHGQQVAGSIFKRTVEAMRC